MSAAEKLKALDADVHSNEPFEILRTEIATDALLAALPQIVAVVEAAEQGRDRSVLIEEHVSTIEKVAWRVEDAQALQAALAALDEALS